MQFPRDCASPQGDIVQWCSLLYTECIGHLETVGDFQGLMKAEARGAELPRTFQPAGAKLSNAPHFLCSKRQNRWYLFNINESTDLVKNQLYFTLDC